MRKVTLTVLLVLLASVASARGPVDWEPRWGHWYGPPYMLNIVLTWLLPV